MPEALVVVDGDDPGAVLLAAALRRHGWRIAHLDLRYERPALDGSGEEPVVRLGDRPVAPDLVLNRTSTSRLGLAPGNALARQLPATWWGRHLAAREEQGLLLACLDLWERTTRLYNPVRTVDRRLLHAAVAAELGAAGVPLGRAGASGDAGDGRVGVSWVVDGAVISPATRVAGRPWRATPLSPATEARLRRTAEVTGLRLGQLDLWQPRAGPTVVTDWKPVPWFRAFWERSGIDAAGLVAAALVGEAGEDDPPGVAGHGRVLRPAPAPPFLAADLEANVLNAGAASVRRS